MLFPRVLPKWYCFRKIFFRGKGCVADLGLFSPGSVLSETWNSGIKNPRVLFETVYLYADIHEVFLLHGNIAYIFSCSQNGREPISYVSTAEILRFSHIFRGLRKRPVSRSELTFKEGPLKTVKDSSRSSKYFWCSAKWPGETFEPRF